MNRETFFTEQLPLIDHLIVWRCRKYGLSEEETEDAAQQIKLRLIENDYAILGKFERRSSIKSFLRVVITNLSKDFLIAKNGKRRPTAQAKRLGPEAEKLEELLRDNHTFDEAVQILRPNCGIELGEDKLYEIAKQLRLRPRRKIETTEHLSELEDQRPQADPALMKESNAIARRVETVLAQAIHDLPDPEDRYLLRARFFKGISVVDIARTQGQNSQQLYRRVAKLCKRQLRQALEAAGLDAGTVLSLLDEGIRVEVDL